MPVLIRGESGTGKELVARTIRRGIGRRATDAERRPGGTSSWPSGSRAAPLRGRRAAEAHRANLLDVHGKYGDVVELAEVLGYLREADRVVVSSKAGLTDGGTVGAVTEANLVPEDP